MTRESSSRSSRIAARRRGISTVRRVTVGVAVSAAAVVSGLTGVLAVTDAATATTSTSTATTQSSSDDDWGTAATPSTTSGSAQTSTSGS